MRFWNRWLNRGRAHQETARQPGPENVDDFESHGTRHDSRERLPATVIIFTGPEQGPVTSMYKNFDRDQATAYVKVREVGELVSWYDRHIESSIPVTMIFYVFPSSSPKRANEVSDWYNGTFARELQRQSKRHGISNSDLSRLEVNSAQRTAVAKSLSLYRRTGVS